MEFLSGRGGDLAKIKQPSWLEFVPFVERAKFEVNRFCTSHFIDENLSLSLRRNGYLKNIRPNRCTPARRMKVLGVGCQKVSGV